MEAKYVKMDNKTDKDNKWDEKNVNIEERNANLETNMNVGKSPLKSPRKSLRESSFVKEKKSNSKLNLKKLNGNSFKYEKSNDESNLHQNESNKNETEIKKNEYSTKYKSEQKVGKSPRMLETKSTTSFYSNNMKEESKSPTKSTVNSELKKKVNTHKLDQSKLEISQVNHSWSEKYKPMNTSQIIGQQGENSNMKKLMNWLKNWHKNHSGPNKPKLSRPSPWAKNTDGAWYKAALLSGPPGVGNNSFNCTVNF